MDLGSSNTFNLKTPKKQQQICEYHSDFTPIKTPLILTRSKNNVRNKFTRSFVPGPGPITPVLVTPGLFNIFKFTPTYEKKKLGLSHTASTRPKSAITTVSTQPGKYELRLVLSNSIIGKGKERLFKGNPGVGSYNLRKEIGSQGVPKYSFGKEKKCLYNTNSNPGPGRYEFRPKIGDAPKYTMSVVKPYNFDSEKVPGVGSYTINKTNKPITPNYKLGHGAQAYDYLIGNAKLTTYKPTIKIKTSKLKRFFQTEYYENKSNIYDSSYFSLGDTSKIKTMSRNDAQSNEYKKRFLSGLGRSHEISNRDDLYRELERKGIPGPGNKYSNLDRTINGPVFKFGTVKRKLSTSYHE